MSGSSDIFKLWFYIYGEEKGVLGLFSGVRPEPGSKELEDECPAYFAWPGERERALRWVEREAFSKGRETYHCAHLLTRRRRLKDNAAPMRGLYVDGDGAKVPEHLPRPSAVVESSPGREQFYWSLTQPVSPEVGEQLNKRLAYSMGADKSGWDLTQLLRPPGTPNFKYESAPIVRLVELTDERHDPAELDRLLPSLPEAEAEGARSHRPENAGPAPNLLRLSGRMRDLVYYGNRGEYPCRSRADMAACIAMFGAGYSEAEVWAVMTDPTNGISEKFFEKGRHGEQYLALTIGKAKARAQLPAQLRMSRVYARRKGVVSIVS